MGQATPLDFLPDRHAVTFRHAPGRHILRANQRNQAIHRQMSESPIAAGDRRLGCQPLMPKIAAQVISDLV
jgi:hypothetical protein